MNRQALEPGLLPIFRLYVFVRLAVMPVIAALYYVRYEFPLKPGLIPVAAMFAADIVFLSVYLSLPWLRRRLGQRQARAWQHGRALRTDGTSRPPPLIALDIGSIQA